MSLTGLNPYALKPLNERTAERKRLSADLAELMCTVMPDADPQILYAAEDVLISMIDTLSDRMHTGHIDVDVFDALLFDVRTAQDTLYHIYRTRGL